MKKVFLTLLSVLALGVLAACGTSVESVSLDESSVELEIGESVTVTATVEPSDAEQGVEWSSGDTGVATVDDGEITAVAAGTATITATSTDDEEMSASVDVTVIPDPSGVSLDVDSLQLQVGESETIEATISPADAVQEVEWSSGDEAIATVDSNGAVTAVGPGVVTITVTATRDSGVTDTAEITVVIAAEEVNTVLETEMDAEVHTVGVVTEITDHRTFFIQDETGAIAVYDSEEAYIGDLESGDHVRVRGVRAAYNGMDQISGILEFEVVESGVELPAVSNIDDVDVEDDDAMMDYQGHRVAMDGYLVEEISTDSYDNYTVTLYSPFDDNRIDFRYDSRLELDESDMLFDLEVNDLLKVDGMILGWYNGAQLLYSGDHTISESDMSLELTINVENDEVAEGALNLSVSETLELDWSVDPAAYVNNQGLDFTSSDDTVVSVDSEGMLTAVNDGTATITMTSQEDASVTAELTVTVENLEVSVNNELNDDDALELRTTEIYEDLDYSVTPEFASQDVTITSSDDAVVSITDDGYLEAVAEGSATLTIVSDADPDASVTLDVVVADSEPVLDFFDTYQIYQDNAEFSILQDATASDYIDGDLTDDLEVTDDGGFDVSTLGTYEATISVTNSFGETTTGEITIEVVEEGAVIAPTGEYNFQYVDSHTRHTLFAAAERFLVENAYGGVPSTVNAGYVLYSNRLQLPVQEPVPVLDYGTGYGTFSSDDSTVIMDDGQPGEAGEYTYRIAETNDPGQYNQWLYDDSISADLISLFMDSLYYFDFNEDKTGYELLPSMADGNPVPIDGAENDYGVMLSKTWQINLKDNLEWYFHEDIDSEDYETTIDAHDFVETYKFALEQNWFRAITGGGDFTSAPQEVVNAQAFADGEVEWEEVGIKAVDDHTIEFEYIENMSEWTNKYFLSSFVTTPIHMGLYEDVGESYGTTEETVAAHGPFYLSYYEADKSIRFRENPEFHDPDRFSYTGYDYQIIADDEIRFQEFMSGRLEAVAVPPAQYESFQNDPRIKALPGATTFRATMNSLGTVDAQEEAFPGSEFEPEPLLAWEGDEYSFRNAMYFAWDRQTIASEVQVTSQPMMYYFSEAYLVDPASGVSFREWDNLEANKELYEESGSTEDFETWLVDNRDPDASIVGEGFSIGTMGYNPDLATRLFEDAIDDLVADGTYELGTADDPLVIDLQFTIQSGSSAQTAYAEYIKEELAETFSYKNDSDEVLAYVNIDIDPVEFPDNYYTRILVGATDVGMGGISGSTLDAASFLDIYKDDGSSAFFMDWGANTSDAEIVVTRVNANGDEVTELWSFNALASALNGTVQVENGEEAE